MAVRMIYMYPQTEEVGLQIITTDKIINKFSQESPYISSTFSRESPKCQTGFHVNEPSPSLSKEFTAKPCNLDIQNFEV